MHLSQIPQHTIQNRYVYISVLNGLSWDMGQLFWGIYEIGHLNRIFWNENIIWTHILWIFLASFLHL